MAGTEAAAASEGDPGVTVAIGVDDDGRTEEDIREGRV